MQSIGGATKYWKNWFRAQGCRLGFPEQSRVTACVQEPPPVPLSPETVALGSNPLLLCSEADGAGPSAAAIIGGALGALVAGTIAAIWNCVSYELRGRGSLINLSQLMRRLVPQSPSPLGKTIPTQCDLFHIVRQAILSSALGTNGDPERVRSALERAKIYLGVDHQPIATKLQTVVGVAPSPQDLLYHQGFSPEVTTTAVKQLGWNHRGIVKGFWLQQCPA